MASLLIALAPVFSTVERSRLGSIETGATSPQVQAARAKAYRLGRKIEGVKLERFLVGKHLQTDPPFNFTFPSLHFHEAGKVILGSAQGLMSENAIYKLDSNKVCISQSSIRGLGCFRVLSYTNSSLMVEWQIESRVWYLVLNIIK